jgi:hypothetical protein
MITQEEKRREKRYTSTAKHCSSRKTAERHQDEQAAGLATSGQIDRSLRERRVPAEGVSVEPSVASAIHP